MFFMDDGVEGNRDFEAEIFSELEQSATLLVIHSRAYVESHSCQREREAFLECLKARGENVDGRIFVVEYEEAERAGELSGLRGYTLWTRDPQSLRGRTLGYPTAQPEDRGYWNTLQDLARELGQELGSLIRASKDSDPERRKPEPELPHVSSTLPSGSVRIVFGTTTDLRALPHDLVTAWALSRGSSLGVIMGQSRGSLLEILTDAESVLSSACSRSGNVRQSARTWLAACPEKHSRVPGDVYEVVAACTSRGSGAVRPPDLPADRAFGFLFEVRADEDGSAPQHVASWCRAIFRRTAAQRDVAALIHVTAPGWHEPRALRTLAERFRNAVGDVPIDWMRAIPDIVDSTAPAPSPNRQANPDEDALARWLRGLPPSATARVPLELGAETSGRDQSQHPPSLRAVAEEVTARCAGAPQQIRAFLLWAERWSPGDLHGLLRAFAEVGTASIRRVTLSVAARADPLVDAWIDGADLRAAAFDEAWFWAADPETGPFVDDLALGLVRRARAGRDVIECQSLLQRLLRARRLSKEMRALVRRWLNDPADHFEHSHSLPRAGLALRSGAVYDPTPGMLRRLKLERVDDWKLLLAHPIAPRTLRDLLSADSPRRAVFGLCTREEWNAITTDPQLVEKIMECRGERSLLFRS